MQRLNKESFKNVEYFKNIVFGIEDSLVSTVGVLFGIASASTTTKEAVLLAGIVIVVVEAVSMGAGSFLTETSAQELEKTRDKKIKKFADSPLVDGIIMFFSYFGAGFVPLTPYFIFPIATAKYVSLTATLISLFILGFAPRKSVSAAFRMTFIAGLAALVGYLVSFIFKQI